MKNILGLDLGTTSIGFAYIVEGETPEQSSIQKLGVRVNPLTTDEQTNFEKGRPVSVNADRTLKRSARRNLSRFKDRRNNLINVLQKANIIDDNALLAEDGKNTTHTTFMLRSQAATQRVEKDELARVLLAINKKRGYKSSRRAKNEEEGQLVDGMGIAKRLYDEGLTPGQLTYILLKEGKKQVPDFYRSDLQAEFDKVWEFQKQFYPEIFTDAFRKNIEGKGQRVTSAAFWGNYNFNTAENKGTREEKRLQAYKWRAEAVEKQLAKEEAAYVVTEINANLSSSSGYLGAISDRSKELYFNKQTVGQYLYKQLADNPHTRLKGQVFYRQDYLDEFEIIWQTQAQYHPELTEALKDEVRDIVIFYQRKLKSQKGLVSFCEFESKEVERIKDGKTVKQTIGLKVAPKSSPLFQEFKIWQVLQNLEFRNKETKEKYIPDEAAKQQLFDELNLKGNLSAAAAIAFLGYKPKQWEANYDMLEGNRTARSFYEAYMKILDIEGYDVRGTFKQPDADVIKPEDIPLPPAQIKEAIVPMFEILGIDTGILNFDAELDGKAFEQQPQYRLWHLLYSAEDDTKKYSEDEIFTYGNDNIGLKKQLCEKFGFKPEHAKILVNIPLSDDYGSLSTKAMRKIYPYIKDNNYSTACANAGYNHSAASLTRDEIANRPLKGKLELLKKNSLRNPVVEKILNQMVNVVNTLIDTENDKLESAGQSRDFKFDEVRIELARELKKNAKERAELSSNINSAKAEHDKIVKVLQSKFGIKNPVRNDIVRYKLYSELKNNGYKDLYTNTYIRPEMIFSSLTDVDHILPQSRLFDDSFSNKTLVFKKDNLEKGNRTAHDYIDSKYGAEGLAEYEARVKMLFDFGVKGKEKEEGISKAKYQKLLKKESEIRDGFIARDLRESQYIAKKAKNMLYDITRVVVSTSGQITDRLREDWGLINIMQELNFEKYKAQGLTEFLEKKDGSLKEVIKDWTKRNDHRHHAMDALTVAFTKQSFIQYLNHLNAKSEGHKDHAHIIGIEQKETHRVREDRDNSKRVFNLPMPKFREQAKAHLESVLISHKAKNKVVTINRNHIKTAKGELVKPELTPRGQLHNETVYGKYRYYNGKEEKIGPKFDEATIKMVSNPQYKKLLLQRLAENDNDPKKAFGGKNALSKNPLYISSEKTLGVPEKVKLIWLEEDYSIRKDITPENFKDLKSIEKILDEGIKRIMLQRLEEFGNDPKKAFTDIEKNPIWLNKEKGISIKRVKISGIKNAGALHTKKDHLGIDILDKNNNPIPVDFISTGSNHHVAIYIDESGKLQDRIVSFFEAVTRAKQKISVVDKNYNSHLGWRLLFTMKQNEYFVFPNEETGFNPSELNLLSHENKNLISPNLFRVQKLSRLIYGTAVVREYVFRHHLETSVIDTKELQGIAYKSIKGLTPFKDIVKVRINHLGDIVQVGEY
ncbi:type II CRISPR RNA-guided endonuclease Cas9 [Flavobacterium sp. Sd200]|uniref:type II CRISPR RNA-guided endonuclease Cas9 n=1 Tax=Flavobacterium sp. Sd200 TaxID=2692211 RepID=UPI00136EE03A|nr:type II CRISPR RNA-guided endonuclease Cas9 [Flavobacterium sp. Sd200]MXN92395.1 type II CRISPR RNA-guided endonuclease Cas9 [Flavobacterium sp. Sd200]